MGDYSGGDGDEAGLLLVNEGGAMKGPDSQVGTGFRALLSPSLWRASVLLWVVWGGFNFAISGFTAFLPQLLDDDANITACTQDTTYTVTFKPTGCVCTRQCLFVSS